MQCNGSVLEELTFVIYNDTHYSTDDIHEMVEVCTTYQSSYIADTKNTLNTDLFITEHEVTQDEVN